MLALKLLNFGTLSLLFNHNNQPKHFFGHAHCTYKLILCLNTWHKIQIAIKFQYLIEQNESYDLKKDLETLFSSLFRNLPVQ